MKRYLELTAVNLIPALVLFLLGFGEDLAISAAVVWTVAGAAYATADLSRLYLSTREPRSRFFRMLLNANALKLLFAGWIAYLIVASILERSLGILLPRPPTEIRPMINGILAVAYLTSSLYYRVETGSIVKDMAADLETELAKERLCPNCGHRLVLNGSGSH